MTLSSASNWLIILLSLFFSCGSAIAQDGRYSGQVIKDESGTVFMEEEVSPSGRQKPAAPSFPIDPAYQGFRSGARGSLIPLLNYGADNSADANGGLEVYNEFYVPRLIIPGYGPQNMFVPYGNPYARPYYPWLPPVYPGISRPTWNYTPYGRPYYSNGNIFNPAFRNRSNLWLPFGAQPYGTMYGAPNFAGPWQAGLGIGNQTIFQGESSIRQINMPALNDPLQRGRIFKHLFNPDESD